MSIDKFLKSVKAIEEKRKIVVEETSHGSDAHDESNWLVSYADMMTLLCGFFIMLFSMASLDHTKYETVKNELAKQFNREYRAASVRGTREDTGHFATQLVQELGLEKEVTVRTDPYGVAMVFQSTVFFDTLSADVRTQGISILDKIIDALVLRQAQEHKLYNIVVEGHTDSRPIVGGVFPSNWELSASRAARVVRMFLAKGFAPNRLTAIGFGDTRPEVPDRTPAGTLDEAALAKNRRVVLRVLEPGTDVVPIGAPEQ